MFPSILNTFARPSPTDRLNNPSHSALHNTVSSALGQVQAVIGLSTSSAVGTLFYDVRSPDSNGGGHVQTAVKGGTGQTTFTKGDILVSTSPSVLSKLAISSTLNDVLIADPSQAAGMKWATNPNANKIVISNSVVTIADGPASVLNTIFSATIPGSTLGSSNGLKYTGVIRNLSIGNSGTVTVKVNYGPNSIATFTTNAITGSVVSSRGLVEGIIVSNNSSSVQSGYVQLNTNNNAGGDSRIATDGVTGFAYGVASVNSNANQDLVIQYLSGTDTQASLVTGFFMVEKIS